MTDYTGIKCPVCGKAFTANDDIVVCPKCGAPYHRECYAEAGSCVFADKHGTPEAWAPPKAEPAPDNSDPNTKRCPRCGTANSQSAIFCEHCGLFLSADQPEHQEFPQGRAPYGGFPQNGMPFNPNQPNGNAPGGFPGEPIPFVFDPMGGVNPNEPIDNIPAGEVAKLVQSNTQYFLPTFMNLARFNRSRFNFSAFLFSGGWMLYRKQYKLGAVITSVMAFLYLVSFYVTVNFTAPLEQWLFEQVGINSESTSFTYAQILQASELLAQQPPEKILLFCIPPMIAIIHLVIMLVVGINGNRWYLKHCVEKIDEIHHNASTPTEISIQFQEHGGVNTPLAICLLVCYMILVYISSI
jgi:Protein of unknown function (DUF2628).